LFTDIRHTLRSLAKTPGFTVGVLLTLALGIGANTAIFSVIDAVLLRPLPFRDPQRLVWFWEMQGPNRGAVTAPDFIDFTRRQRVFESLAASTGTTLNL